LGAQLLSAATFFSRIERPGSANDDMRKFVRTIRSHLHEAGAAEDDETVWQLLRRLQILVFDFTAQGSASVEQAAESLTHAQRAGEMITMLGEYPSLTIGPLLDSYQHDVEAIMRESLESEAKALALYRELLKCAEGHSVVVEEYARQMVYAEELHASEVDKMLRKPGKVVAFRPPEHLPGNRI
jgi:bacterioferritin (cytochrome b1)